MVFFRFCEKCGKRFQPTGKNCKVCDDCKANIKPWLIRLKKKKPKKKMEKEKLDEDYHKEVEEEYGIKTW
jgi:hypothetical protein